LGRARGVLRIVLTIVAVELLKLSYLKLIGGALLFWIAVKLLVRRRRRRRGQVELASAGASRPS